MQTELIGILVRSTIMTLMLTLGLSLTPAEIIAPWKRGEAWVKALLAVVIFPPMVAILVNLGLPEGSLLGTILLGLAAAPGAPMTTRRAVKAGGKLSYAASLQVAVSVLAVITIPICAAIYRIIFPGEYPASPLAYAKVILLIQLIPIGVGLLVRELQPAFAIKAEAILSKIANLLFILLILGILALTFPLLLKVGTLPFLVFTPIVALWLSVGHLLAGPVLAIGSIARNIALVLLFIGLGMSPGDTQEKLALVLAYLLVGAIGGAVYSALLKRSKVGQTQEESSDTAAIRQ